METMTRGRLQPSRGSGRHERRQLQQGEEILSLAATALDIFPDNPVCVFDFDHTDNGDLPQILRPSCNACIAAHCSLSTSGSLCSSCVTSLRFLRIKMRAILPGSRRSVIMFGRLHTCIRMRHLSFKLLLLGATGCEGCWTNPMILH